MKIDKNSQKALYLQICDNIIDEIINGYLIAEEKLPSRRKLCSELNISPQTVENAYQKLIAEGYIISRPGSGYYVSSERVWDEEQQAMKSRIYNFSSNGVETSKLPFTAWAKLLRSTVKDNAGLFQHGEKAGEWCLRKSIRRLLFRTQNIKCRTEQIIIGPGAEDLLREIFDLLDDDNPILMNNYYNYRVHSTAVTSRKQTKYISTDKAGINIDEIYKYNKAILYQKPTHDLPTGITLTQKKRNELAAWADGNRYLIEDSSENDYQYYKKEKTLWELTNGKNVIYLGSFSGTIAPSMKIGYIVVPDEIAALWFKKKRFYANRVSRIEQVTLSKFIDLGYYEKHINYMRDIYKEKTIAIKRAVLNSPLGKITTISGDDAGMFCMMHFDIKLPEKKAKKILADNGIKLSPLSSSLKEQSQTAFPENSYTVGYGEMTISQIKDGIKLLSNLWKDYI
ncbi:MAG: PLP-dependent aminotransferase family protein [Clostridia bacterium]